MFCCMPLKISSSTPRVPVSAGDVKVKLGRDAAGRTSLRWLRQPVCMCCLFHTTQATARRHLSDMAIPACQGQTLELCTAHAALTATLTHGPLGSELLTRPCCHPCAALLMAILQRFENSCQVCKATASFRA